ncbi:uncharacterized protein LOC119588769 [Penaeus monodon]|uniref:uncharacterized protein LOC119588769 n=1 Tax=Penaeus monodon TaxID=6687 RepID=UPI0018A759DB|nr:uncharacterized protein LOC119588769 [Penaeus monodon]XP_037793339.1 uncharacterized protein LOC119588769 [Penaeus monodon]
MRILFINIYVAVVALVTIRAQSPEANDSSESQQSNEETVAGGKKMMNLMNKHLQDSLTYLFTSKQYHSQYWERPGMAKYLKELSDKEWEEGLDTLKKFMQRGGKIGDFREQVKVSARGQLRSSSDEMKNDPMPESLKKIHRDSKRKFSIRNGLMVKVCTKDAEICHFLEEGLAKEAERMYELKSYHTIAFGLKTGGVGLSLFDASL